MDTCFECDAPATQHHHVVPVSLGGTRTVPLCDDCHAMVHGRRAVDVSTLTKVGLARRKREGKVVGMVPYGYRRVGDHLEEDPDEQRVVDVIRRLRGEGLSLRAVVAKLEEYGVPARGERWHKTTVVRILSS